MTFPNNVARGAEESTAVFSTVLLIAEIFTGHLPVSTGSGALGKYGYIGGVGTIGGKACGTTEGEICMGLKRSLGEFEGPAE